MLLLEGLIAGVAPPLSTAASLLAALRSRQELFAPSNLKQRIQHAAGADVSGKGAWHGLGHWGRLLVAADVAQFVTACALVPLAWPFRSCSWLKLHTRCLTPTCALPALLIG